MEFRIQIFALVIITVFAAVYLAIDTKERFLPSMPETALTNVGEFPQTPTSTVLSSTIGRMSDPRTIISDTVSPGFSPSPGEFHGPTARPHIIGPRSGPPNY